MQVKPFIKWVGGKRQLLKEIESKLPTKFNNYFELFLGGGAVFFNHEFKPNQKCYLNDYNDELFNLYNIVKNSLPSLIDDLDNHVNEKEYFLKIRALDRIEGFKKSDVISRASRFIYLNKTAFNGMWRVNSKNQYNVPFANYKNPDIKPEAALTLASEKLKDATLSCGSYIAQKDKIKKGDFVYLDPPYDPLNKTSSFTSYTDSVFGDKEQSELRDFCNYLNSIGAYFMLSNSNTDFINELYKDYHINTVSAKRNINSKGDKRGAVLEVLVTNYEVK
jgi:DNA adenine methylase